MEEPVKRSYEPVPKAGPIPVRLSTSRVQIMCAACTYRTEVVSDYRTAEQVFQTEHGELETAS